MARSFLMLLVLVCHLYIGTVSSQQRPNILLVITDDQVLRWKYTYLTWVTSCLLVVCLGCLPGRHDPDGEDCQAAGPGRHHLQQRLRQHPDLLSIQVKLMWSKLLIHVFVIAALKISCFSKVQQWQNEIKDVALNCAFAGQNFISHKFIFLSSSKCAQKQSVRRKIRNL